MKTYLCEIPFAYPQYDEALRLREELLRKPLGLQFNPEDIAEEWRHTCLGLYSLANDALLGLVQIVDTDDHETCRVKQVCVVENFQGLGLGKILMNKVEDSLREMGYRAAVLNARIVVKGFYQKLNYNEIGDEFQELDIVHQKMKKPLNAP